MIRIHRDWKEWLDLLKSEKVEYLVIGGVAVAFHAIPRYTGDLDLLINPTEENGRRIVQALDKFGFGSFQAEPRAFTMPERMLSMGNEPVRIEILTSIPGVVFSESGSVELR